MSVRVRDRGWNAIIKASKKLNGRKVAVGVVGADADRDRGGVTNADLAVIHEYGTDRIPARSFLGGTMAATRKDLDRFIASRKRKVEDGELSVDQALEQIGMRHAADIQEFIADGIDPPNAPRTIELKGSSKPLIDSGQLRQSITHDVRD